MCARLEKTLMKINRWEGVEARARAMAFVIGCIADLKRNLLACEFFRARHGSARLASFLGRRAT